MRVSFIPVVLALFVAPLSASALTINLDYSQDTTDFFGLNPVAKLALEAAASDLSSYFAPSLGAVNTDVFTGTNGSSTATFNWKLTYTNPSTGATVTLDTFSYAAENVTIYVGARSLAGTTLGVGGPGGAGFTFSRSSFENELVGAVA